MDKRNKIGISDISLYAPSNQIDIRTLVETREQESHGLSEHLNRAEKTAGQSHLRFPSPWDDPVTLASNACATLLEKNPDFPLSDLRYLSAGTESSVDFSKPISSYVQGNLEKAGFKIPKTITTDQVQHACAGGVLSLFNVAHALAVSREKRESGIVMTSDVARYKPYTTAELTQGAGATSLFVTKNPKLLELDLTSLGRYSSSVDDFFRPTSSEYPQVRGQYSLQCYMEAMTSAFHDLSRRRGKSMRNILKETAMTIFHIPFAKMAEMAVLRLFGRCGGIDTDEIRSFLNHEGFCESLRFHRNSGNWYTGSFFLHLATSLQDNYRLKGKDIVGENILCFSYGSGNTMLAFTAKIAPKAPSIIESWSEPLLPPAQTVDFEAYRKWLEFDTNFSTMDVPKDLFYLEQVREDGFRIYNRS